MLLKKKLQRFQNNAERVLTGANYDISSSELLERLNWKNFDTRVEFNKAVLLYSIFENGNAACLRQQFSAQNNNTNDYNLRNYGTDLSIPKPKKEFLKRSFKYRGAVLWNNLPYQPQLHRCMRSRGLLTKFLLFRVQSPAELLLPSLSLGLILPTIFSSSNIASFLSSP